MKEKDQILRLLRQGKELYANVSFSERFTFKQLYCLSFFSKHLKGIFIFPYNTFPSLLVLDFLFIVFFDIVCLDFFFLSNQ